MKREPLGAEGVQPERARLAVLEEQEQELHQQEPQERELEPLG